MLRIKICGITRREDALFSIELGADAVGFIFYDKSLRNIKWQAAAEIARLLPSHVAKVGVFVNPLLTEVNHHIEKVGLDAVQIHGEHRFAEFRTIPPNRLIYALQVGGTFDLRNLESYRNACTALLLDGFKSGAYGGTGKTFDWEIAVKAKTYKRIIMAGGLTPQNAALAVERVHPYAIDVNSGVETRPGVKDHNKLRELFTNLKEYRNGWKPAKGGIFSLA